MAEDNQTLIDPRLLALVKRAVRGLEQVAYDASIDDKQCDSMSDDYNGMTHLIREYEMGRADVSKVRQAVASVLVTLQGIDQSTLDSNIIKTLWFGALTAARQVLQEIPASQAPAPR